MRRAEKRLVYACRITGVDDYGTVYQTMSSKSETKNTHAHTRAHKLIYT